MNTFHLDILAAEGSFFSGACESLIVTTPEGQRGILAHRANIITALVPGELIFRTPDGSSISKTAAAVSSQEDSKAKINISVPFPRALRPFFL